jgi:hypothetical protein
MSPSTRWSIGALGRSRFASRTWRVGNGARSHVRGSLSWTTGTGRLDLDLERLGTLRRQRREPLGLDTSEALCLAGALLALTLGSLGQPLSRSLLER